MSSQFVKSENVYIRLAKAQLRILTSSKPTLLGFAIIATFAAMAIVGPLITQYSPFQSIYVNGQLAALSPPGYAFPLGTNTFGQDILTQVLVGARVSLVVGILAALGSVFIGTNVGLIAGYLGGKTDQILMRIVDFLYSLPFEGLAIVLVALAGPGLLMMTVVISILIWRGLARVVRSEVLKIRELSYVKVAKAYGSGNFRIIYRHILPNVIATMFVYFATNMQSAILAEATLSFLGLGDPYQISWGQMLQQAFNGGALAFAWWWWLPPAFCITVLVMGAYLIATGYKQM
jgi:peptide/nickel transport system permease protein